MSGLHAANALLEELDGGAAPPPHPVIEVRPARQRWRCRIRIGRLSPRGCNSRAPAPPALEVRPDQPQVTAAIALNKRVMGALKPLGLASPWVR